MKPIKSHRVKVTFIYIALILLTIFWAFCSRPREQHSEKLSVAASIEPLRDFVQQIGGDRVEVFTIVPPGASPHTFELTAEQMLRIAKAKMLVLNGVGLEYWAQSLSDNIQKSNLLIVDTSNGIEIVDDEHEGGGNPHIWLNPLNAIRQAEAIGSALIKIAPGDSAYYRRNMNRFIGQLSDLDREIEAQVSTWRNKSFVCFHPAWIYFANRYGFSQAAVIERRPGVEPNPKELAEIVQTVRKMGVKAIFADAQFSTKTTEVISSESGASVLVLDPLGANSYCSTYLEMMRFNIRKMEEALK
jgi:zinc transport system substrate-binding protein